MKDSIISLSDNLYYNLSYYKLDYVDKCFLIVKALLLLIAVYDLSSFEFKYIAVAILLDFEHSAIDKHLDTRR